jgi:hypothetical protein
MAQTVQAQAPRCVHPVLGDRAQNLRTSVFDRVSRSPGVYSGGVTSLTTLRTSRPSSTAISNAALSLPSVSRTTGDQGRYRPCRPAGGRT